MEISKSVLKQIVEIINANSFCSLSRDSEVVMKLSKMLVRGGLLKRVDRPYIGCVAIKKKAR